MNATNDIERRIADYYATEAPYRAPGWLLAQALDTVDTTPQRRTLLGRPWRFPPMTSFAKLAVGAVAIVAVGAIGLTLLRLPAVGPAASPSPTGSPPPSSLLPPPVTEHFTSTIHGISIDYPAGWQIRPATEPWTGGELSFDSPAADVLYDPVLGDRLYLVVASQPYGDLSQNEWQNKVLTWTCLGFPDAGGEVWSWRVDGFHAWQQGPCNSGSLIFTDTRGYLIRLVASSGEPGLADTYNWNWLAGLDKTGPTGDPSVLESADLRPEEAVDAPSPSQSP